MDGYLWYRSVLSGEERAIYDAMMHHLATGEAEFRIPKCENQRLSQIWELVKMDCPTIFYVDGFRYRSIRGESTMTLLPEYTFRGKQREEMVRSLEKRISRILEPWSSLPSADALAAIHDFILTHVTYDKVKKNYSHEIVGVLHHGIGVCEGISKMVKLFCDRLDLPCVIALGKGSLREDAERHAWNVIRLEGSWRHYDFTYDLSASRHGYGCMRYFGMDDQRCFQSHGNPEHPLPSCSETEELI